MKRRYRLFFCANTSWLLTSSIPSARQNIRLPLFRKYFTRLIHNNRGTSNKPQKLYNTRVLKIKWIKCFLKGRYQINENNFCTEKKSENTAVLLPKGNYHISKKILFEWHHCRDVYHVPGLLYVVDSADRERISESREELFNIMENVEMQGKPIVVIANKQDLPSKYLL